MTKVTAFTEVEMTISPKLTNNSWSQKTNSSSPFHYVFKINIRFT